MNAVHWITVAAGIVLEAHLLPAALQSTNDIDHAGPGIFIGKFPHTDPLDRMCSSCICLYECVTHGKCLGLTSAPVRQVEWQVIIG